MFVLHAVNTGNRIHFRIVSGLGVSGSNPTWEFGVVSLNNTYAVRVTFMGAVQQVACIPPAFAIGTANRSTDHAVGTQHSLQHYYYR